MFESSRLVATDALYIVAHLTTASLYLFWNDLVPHFSTLAIACLSSRSSPIPLSLLKLHCLVLASFVLATCFRATTAVLTEVQHGLMISPEEGIQVLGFDDISTDDSGFGIFAASYHHLNFNGLYPFDPRADTFNGRISLHDLNCAVSLPNGLYGARFGADRTLIPAFTVNVNSTAKFGLKGLFTLHGMKIKPLDFPLSHTTVYLRGYGAADPVRVLTWEVDFPLGFHDMLHVKMEDFSGVKWDELGKVEIWADLHYDGGDWEFCLDDLEIEFTKSSADDAYP